MTILEGNFKRRLIEQIEEEFPGAIVLKLDANNIQGIPDHLILYKNKWASFEAKRSSTASHRLNQDYYVNLLNSMSFAAFVYPQNKEWFLDELQQTLRPRRRSRLSIGV